MNYPCACSGCGKHYYPEDESQDICDTCIAKRLRHPRRHPRVTLWGLVRHLGRWMLNELVTLWRWMWSTRLFIIVPLALAGGV